MVGSISISFGRVGKSPAMLAAKIGTLSFQLRSFREPLTESADYLSSLVKENFDSGGNPPWEPLAPSTIKRKGHSQPLIRTGKLRRRASQKNVWRVENRDTLYAVLPSDVDYGWFHETGFKMANTGPTKNKTHDHWGNELKTSFVPARPFLPDMNNSNIRKDIADIFDQWIEMRIARAMK